MDTDRLIRTLAAGTEPVAPLRPPWVRTLAWTAAGAMYLLALVAAMSLRSDLDARLREPRFLVEQLAALLTGVTAAAAAFATVVPGHRRGIIGWTVASAALWIGTIGAGAYGEIGRAGVENLFVQADWGCVWTVLVGAAVPAGVMARMLRRGAPLTPHVTAALGGLAAAGLGNLGICLFHPHSSSLVMLVWHSGTVLALAALAATMGGRLLHWPARRIA
jgi:hypothetical protein